MRVTFRHCQQHVLFGVITVSTLESRSGSLGQHAISTLVYGDVKLYSHFFQRNNQIISLSREGGSLTCVPTLGKLLSDLPRYEHMNNYACGVLECSMSFLSRRRCKRVGMNMCMNMRAAENSLEHITSL